MNTKRMLALAAEIENPTSDLQFNMISFTSQDPKSRKVTVQHMCDTRCCIGGTAVVMFGSKKDLIGPVAAIRLLGLTSKQADRLFYAGIYELIEPKWGHVPFDEITREQAAYAIRKMVELEGESQNTLDQVADATPTPADAEVMLERLTLTTK